MSVLEQMDEGEQETAAYLLFGRLLARLIPGCGSHCSKKFVPPKYCLVRSIVPSFFVGRGGCL